MAKFNTNKPAFIAGQISPKALGRADLPQYQFACEELINMLPALEGGACQRPGSQYVSGTQANAQTRLIEFIYSKTESYMIEVYPGGFNAFSTIQGRTKTNFGTNSYTLSEIHDIQYVQSANVLYLVHPNHPPLQISRLGVAAFSVQTFDPNYSTGTADPTSVLRWPFMNPNIDVGFSITPSGTSGTITLTSSKALFNAGHVHSIFKLSWNGNNTGAVRIISVSTTTSATAQVLNTLPFATATTDWEESYWSDYRGWPRAICFFGSRLVYGGTNNNPDTIFASRYNNFTLLMNRKFEQDSSTDSSGLKYFGAVVNTDAVSFFIASQQVNAIQWLASGSVLFCGTLGQECAFSTIDAQNITLGNVQSQYGSSYIPAHAVGHTLLFVKRSGRHVMELEFDFYISAYKSNNLSRFSGNKPIGYFDWSDSDQTMWAYSTELYTMFRDREAQAVAWASHDLSGGYSGEGIVSSLASAPSSNGGHDDIWVVVQRVINGTPSYYIEVIGQAYVDTPFADRIDNLMIDASTDVGDISAAPTYVDSSIYSYSVTPSSTITAAHLKGKTISALLDGFAYTGLTADSVTGVITLPTPASSVIVGLPMTAKVRPVRPEAGAVLGSAQGATKRVDRAVVRFYRTVAAKIGPSYSNTLPINFRDTSLPLNSPIPMFSGDQVVSFPSGFDRDGYVCLLNDQPVPMNLLSVAARGETNEG